MRVVLFIAYFLFSIGCSVEQPPEVSSHTEAMNDESETAVLALIEALKDNDKVIRRRACITLGDMGFNAKAAVPALIEALKDQDEKLRKLAASALESIGPK